MEYNTQYASHKPVVLPLMKHGVHVREVYELSCMCACAVWTVTSVVCDGQGVRRSLHHVKGMWVKLQRFREGSTRDQVW